MLIAKVIAFVRVVLLTAISSICQRYFCFLCARHSRSYYLLLNDLKRPLHCVRASHCFSIPSINENNENKNEKN